MLILQLMINHLTYGSLLPWENKFVVVKFIITLMLFLKSAYSAYKVWPFVGERFTQALCRVLPLSVVVVPAAILDILVTPLKRQYDRGLIELMSALVPRTVIGAFIYYLPSLMRMASSTMQACS